MYIEKIQIKGRTLDEAILRYKEELESKLLVLDKLSCQLIDENKYVAHDQELGVDCMDLSLLDEQIRIKSSYNYAFNNPIYYIDSDGMVPVGLGGTPPDVITTVSKTRGDKHFRQRNVSMKMTLTVVNLSGTDLSKTAFSKSSGTVSYSSFKGRADSDNRYLDVKNIDRITDVSVEYKVVSSFDDVGENDHVMMIVGEISGGGKYNGITGGKGSSRRVMAVEKGTISSGDFDETAQHEIGHSLGAGHNDYGVGLMNGDGSTGDLKLNNKERGELVSGQLNPLDGDGVYQQSKNGHGGYDRSIQEQIKNFINLYNIKF